MPSKRRRLTPAPGCAAPALPPAGEVRKLLPLDKAKDTSIYRLLRNMVKSKDLRSRKKGGREEFGPRETR